MSLPRFLFFFVLTSITVVAALHPDIEYGQAGGESLRLDANVPPGSGPCPAVILVHGGGWTSGDKSGGPNKAFIAPLHEPLQGAGFAWFSINYRLAPRHTYPACVDDVVAAIRWVKQHAAEYRIDPKRIAISGESAGGHLVALAAMRPEVAGDLAAVVPFYGVFDMPALQKPGDPLRPSFAALFGRKQPDEATMKLLRAASPVEYVRRGLPPFLLVHGTADTRVPLDQSQRLQARLQEVGVACELLTIPGGNHGMIGWKLIAPDYGARVAAWLQRTMPATGH